MIEITAIVLFVTFVLIGRMTKPRQLERPVVISRSGNYHVVLASRLNLAVSYIEHIARSFRAQPALPGDSPTVCLVVHDPALKCHAIESYLLAITLRGNQLYFQAVRPDATAADPYHQVHEFADKVLQNISASGEARPELAQRLLTIAEQVAAGHEIRVQPLQV